MQITEHGRTNASTINFAEQLRNLTVAMQSLGENEENGKSLIVTFTACVLTDTPPPDWLTNDEIGRPLSPAEQAEFLELRAFVDAHAAEIDRVVGSALEKLVEQATGPGQRAS
jgi:hypothetical protein